MPTLTHSASRMLRIREVSPSPLSLASQHLQTKLYMTPLVGTTMVSSSISQQLSGVAPSCPTCEGQRENISWGKGFLVEGCDSPGNEGLRVCLHRHNKAFFTAMEGTLKQCYCHGQGNSGHQLLCMREGQSQKKTKVDWTDLHGNMSTLLSLCSCAVDVYIHVFTWQQTHFSTFTSFSTSVTTLGSDYSKLYSQEERCSANTHVYYYKHFPHKSTYKWTKWMRLFLCFPSP